MTSKIFRAAFLAVAAFVLLETFVAVPAEATPGVTIQVFRCSSSDCSSKTAVSSGPVAGVLQVQAKTTLSGLLPPALKSLDITVKPSSSSSAVCLYHVTNPNNGSVYTTNWSSASYPANAPSGCASSSLYGTLSRNESIVISARATDMQNNAATASVSALSLNNPPAPPTWAADPSVSGASKRAPVVTLKWNKSPEPDVQEYRFLRTDPSGTTKQYPVSASNYAAQGCSFDGTTYTCYDTDFPSTGFGGTYSYGLTVYRSSPSQADTCYYPNQQMPCIGAASSQVKQVSITEPSPSPTPTGGNGGSGGGAGGSATPGGGGGVVPTGAPSIGTPRSQQPQSPTHVLGQNINPGDCFTCGTYKETLPYGSLPGDGQTGTVVPGTGQRPVFASGPEESTGSSGPDPRQLWVSIAAGLVLLMTAGHVARVLRSTAR